MVCSCVKLLNKVHHSFQYSKVQWTNLTDVMNWLSSHPLRWPIFITNHVSEIITKIPRSNKHQFHPKIILQIVQVEDYPDRINKKSLWCNGPTWFENEEYNWPTHNSYPTSILSAPESFLIICNAANIQNVSRKREDTWHINQTYVIFSKNYERCRIIS